MKKRILSYVFAFLLLSACAYASTLVLEGGADSSINLSEERGFTVPATGLKKLTFRFANPGSFKTVSTVQSVSKRRVVYDPRPASVITEKDGFGNTYTTVTWTDLKRDATVREDYSVTLGISLRGFKSSAPFPLPSNIISAGEARYLGPTPLVQSESTEVKDLAKRLTSGAKTEQSAVMGILDWVVDNVRYRSPADAYDAVTTLRTRQGNCQNFSHLSIALLRASGIPARIVGGVALGKPWRVPLKEGALLQSIGQGGHAWIEVWYPDLGWVPYDAQQSHLFVGPRHIKETIGLDSNDINDSWRASPALPPFTDDISAEFTKDEIGVELKATAANPKSYIMTASLAPSVLEEATPLPKPAEKPIHEEGETEFGNTEFPALMDFYVRTNLEGKKTFDKETAEYVTGETAYAQAFTISTPLQLEAVSLAMHKFGGRAGSLWVDIVKDKDGIPGMEGVRSLPLSLDTVRFTPGYGWLDFKFASQGEGDSPVLDPGRYWIVLRHSKDAVVNWFYIPGNPYGPPDDTRSTSTGIDWSDILNYDFNFKVKGRFLR